MSPAPFSIRELQISPGTVLAPMAGVTDTVFRRMIRGLGGCGLIMTEFTSAECITRNNARTSRYLFFEQDERPITGQLFGADADVMGRAAGMVEQLGFDIVDVNLGCPARKVVKCGGSGLLRDLKGLEQVLRAVRAAVKIPMTIKIRAGWDVNSPADAMRMLTETGCDAVMIGRAASNNPWIFRQIAQFAATGSYDEPSEWDRYQLLSLYFRNLVDTEWPDAIGRMKQFTSYFTHGVRNGGELRGSVHVARTTSEILDRVDAFFAQTVT